MALQLTLKPNERVIISGAVIRNGDSRTELRIENEVPVLRESDILSPSMVRTPSERIYLALQLMYVDPERAQQHLTTCRGLIEELLQVAPSCRPLAEEIDSLAVAGKLYHAIKVARALLAHERELLTHVHERTTGL